MFSSMNARSRLIAAVALVAAVQTAVLAWMVVNRVQHIRTGQEIVVPIVPVDPRDLFRGDFVRLAYDFSTVKLKDAGTPTPVERTPVYATLEKQADNTWKLTEAALTRPQAVGKDQIVLRGRIAWGPTWRTLPGGGREDQYGGRFGIESYFVPEGKGLELEKMARDKKLAAILAVNAKGEPAIKGLMIDGKVVYDEPLL